MDSEILMLSEEDVLRVFYWPKNIVQIKIIWIRRYCLLGSEVKKRLGRWYKDECEWTVFFLLSYKDVYFCDSRKGVEYRAVPFDMSLNNLISR